MTSYTPKLDLAKQDTGAQGWGTVLNQNFDKIDAGFGEIGVKVYSGTVTYTSGEFVIASVSGVVGLYKSLQGNNVGHALTDTTWWEEVPLGGGDVDVDGKSITKNSSDELQTIGVINQNDTTTALKVWSGDEADLPATKDSNTFYATEELGVNLLDTLYPVGSIYITTNATCPLSTLIAGSTWVQETSRVLVEKKEPTDNDPTWYNLYSDGWCEQGGVLTTSSSTEMTVAFIKAFANTDYMVTGGSVCGNSTSGIDAREVPSSINAKTTEGFTKYLWTGYSPYFWQACGYTSTTTSHKQFRRTA